MAFDGLWYECNNYETETSEEQCECEKDCSDLLTPLDELSRKRVKELSEQNFINNRRQFCLLRRYI